MRNVSLLAVHLYSVKYVCDFLVLFTSMQPLLFLLSILSIKICNTQIPLYDKELYSDSLTPYTEKHGSRLSHRSIRECHKEEFGSVPHELFLAHKSLNFTEPFVQVKQFVRDIGSKFMPRIIRGHYVIISDPLRTLSVLEPDQPGGCSLSIRQTVVGTSRKNNCVVGINAGYFDTKNGLCLGNVISNGKLVHDSKGVQNAHFGLTKDGEIFVGYVSHEDVVSNEIEQLVGGVIWILRNGTSFVNYSKVLECEKTEETGPMEDFINIRSARSAVGHDVDGNVVFVQVDGKSSVDGINLLEMETLLKGFGLVNAINLDGGGSSTLVVNGTTVNYPYDDCDTKEFSCDRKVSTILCVHSPYCDPVDCSQHGVCSNGLCLCHENWLPPKCDQMYCKETNCSNNGVCSSEGCVCHPGYVGRNCNQSCPEDSYGVMCSRRCDCYNSVGCDAVTGACNCRDGYTGTKCQSSCPVGFYGKNCQLACSCNNSCVCDHVTGSCEIHTNSSFYKAASCMAESIIHDRHLVNDNESKWFQIVILLGVITSVSVASVLLLLYCSCSCYCRNRQVLCSRPHKEKRHLQVPSGYLSDSMSEDEIFPMNTYHKN